MRLLCTGDIHLGRHPSRIPADSVTDPKRFTTSAGWEAIVDLAIEERVDLLIISGDLVDLRNRFYEALGPVESGIARLRERGIPVVAVAGNHDYSSAQLLADRFGDGFRLLGQKQRWERHTVLDNDGRPQLHIDGWSFANEHVADDPLTAYALPPAHDAPVLGLLHADLDSAEQRYAPVRLRDLQRAPVSAWLLGHIHVPRLWEAPGCPPILYPGSPVPLDPGESGRHGVWFLDIEPDRPARCTFRPIARHRYETLTIDLTGVERVDEAGQRVTDAVRDHLLAAKGEPDGATLEHLLARVLLTGTVPVGLDLASEIERMQTGYRFADRSIESIRDLTRPRVDLHALAGEKSPPGAIARLLLALREEPDRHPLIQAAAREAQALDRHPQYGLLADAPEISPGIALEQASWQLLDALIAQREHRA